MHGLQQVYSLSSFQHPEIPFQSVTRSLRQISKIGFFIAATANAATNPNDLGINSDGLLNLCPSKSCISSQDDRPAVFQPPWCYDGPFETMKRRILDFIDTKFTADTFKLVSSSDRYLR